MCACILDCLAEKGENESERYLPSGSGSGSGLRLIRLRSSCVSVCVSVCLRFSRAYLHIWGQFRSLSTHALSRSHALTHVRSHAIWVSLSCAHKLFFKLLTSFLLLALFFFLLFLLWFWRRNSCIWFPFWFWTWTWTWDCDEDGEGQWRRTRARRLSVRRRRSDDRCNDGDDDDDDDSVITQDTQEGRKKTPPRFHTYIPTYPYRRPLRPSRGGEHGNHSPNCDSSETLGGHVSSMASYPDGVFGCL